MNRKLTIAISLAMGLAVAGAGATYFQSSPEVASSADAHGDEEHADEGGHSDEKDHAVGANGGIILSQEGFGLELVAPESADGSAPMSIYLSQNGQRITPDVNSRVFMEVRRPGGEVSSLPFSAKGEAFVSTQGIAEPHFFEATIVVQRIGRTLRFAYAKEEGLIKLDEEQITTADIRLEQAQAREMSATAKLPGEIRFDEDRTAHVVPRTAGVVESVHANLGDAVKKGQLLAVIASQQISEQRSELAAAGRRLELAKTTFERERQLWKEGISAEQDYLQARQALQEAEIAAGNARQKMNALGGANALIGGNRYELRAPFDGTVVEKHLVLGELVGEASNAFTISDLSRVWATFNISPKDLNKLQVGKPVKVISPELQTEVAGNVSYIGSLLGEQTRSAVARAVLTNPEGAWRPGLFVTIEFATATSRAGVSVPTQAIQSIDEKPHVFIRVDEGFVAQPVETGTTSAGFVEITKGLSPGANIATQGSFTLKSELGKGSADHAH
ncbi:efflux RND transporter periplasmic adaptor subunit [Pseudomonas sp. ML96]|uniref:efflux RND transporter periplasmic adaptor subunit n=1 Tax=Pseudomonas sp. ML96 TaxID=1523503 RepID=UPI0009DD5BDA